MNPSFSIPNDIVAEFIDVVKDWQMMFIPNYNYLITQTLFDNSFIPLSKP